jgi:hypothetical protein
MFKIVNRPMLRTITVQMSGYISEEEATRAEAEFRRAVDGYRGKPYLVLADGRGQKPTSAAVAEILQRTIHYGRAHGTACCVHLYDSAIARLQAARLAREVMGGTDDTVTVEVISTEEADQVLKEERQRLWAENA